MLKNLTIENIVKVTGGKYYGPDELLYTCVEGVDLDSRKIEAGYLFIATKGERVDGHSFIESVLEKGALAVIGEDDCREEWKPYIKVESSFKALKDIAKFYRMQLDIPIVGVTGSVGKTGTKEAIAAVLSTKYDVLKTAGNFNNEVGLPLTVLRIRDNHQVAVLEMGISDFGEMHRLAEIAIPDICVMTNIGLCHLENLGTQEGIYKAKSEAFEHMNGDGKIVLFADDPILSTKTDINGNKPFFFGTKESSFIYAKNINNLGLLGSEFVLCNENNEYNAKVNLPGYHSVINSTAAAAVGKLLGLDMKEIVEGISQIKAINGRSNLIQTDKYLIIDDCYNANPVSMKEAIDLLTSANGRKVAVLGDMFELGENSDALHYSVGEYAADKNIDVIVLAGKNSLNMLAALKDKGKENDVSYFEDTDTLLASISNIIKEGDSILIKASHGMHYEKILNKLETETI